MESIEAAPIGRSAASAAPLHNGGIGRGCGGSLLGLANFGAYNAAKGRVISLTRTAATEGASQNIRVNSIAPGATKPELRSAIR
ncbi:MAG: SDR family oxidoreductase [Gemmatimonadota bacterium]